MKGVLVRIRGYSARASEAEKGVADLIMKNPELVVNMSIHQLAADTFTSASTIIRLCRKLGFEGYKDLRKALLYEVSVRKEVSEEQTRKIEREDSLNTIVQKVTYRNIVSLENTNKLLNMDALAQCVELIDRAENVILFGMGASLLVAKDACLKFVRVNKSCHFGEDWHMQMLYARNSCPNDVAIAISYSGMTQETIRCAETVKNNGTPLITITRFDALPLSKFADYNLYVESPEMFARIGAMSSRMAQFNIIDIIYTAYVNRNYDECIPKIINNNLKQDTEDTTGGER